LGFGCDLPGTGETQARALARDRANLAGRMTTHDSRRALIEKRGGPVCADCFYTSCKNHLPTGRAIRFPSKAREGAFSRPQLP
jgi:hypothetical protein